MEVNNTTLRTFTFVTNEILLKAELPGAAVVHLLQCHTELVDDILPFRKSKSNSNVASGYLKT